MTVLSLRSSTRLSSLVVTGIFTALSAAHVQAAPIAQWNFNTVPPDALTSTGTTTPTVDLVTGTPTFGGTNVTTTVYASGQTTSNTSFPLDNSSDPATSDDSAFGIQGSPAQGTGDRTSGVVIALNTTGWKDITLTWDQRTSRFSSRYWQVQYSTNGTTFTDVGSLFAPAAVDRYQAVSGGGSTLAGVSYNQFNNGITRSFGSLLDEQATAYIRIVAAFDPATGTGYLGNFGNDGAASNYPTLGSSNTVAFDVVTVGGTSVPEPASLGLISAGLLLLTRRRRRA